LNTGFDGYLTLPLDIARHIIIMPLGPEVHTLADGSRVRCPVGSTRIDWNEEERETEVLIVGKNPLMGTRLLEGAQLTIEMNEGGEVFVEL
jgi:clan AA aspartic protease